tara:strand:- start:337 stop:747 length:411 start_codon:yes stop_codon:yes gene_type:complete
MKKLNSSEIEFVVKEILNEVSENIINNKEVEFSNNIIGKELVEDYKDIIIREENLVKLKDRVRSKENKLKEIYNIKVNKDFNRYDEFEIEKGKIYSLRGNVNYKIKEEISRKVMLENLKGNNIEDLISSLVKEFSS